MQRQLPSQLGGLAFRHAINRALAAPIIQRERFTRELAQLLKRLETTEHQLREAIALYERANEQARTDALTGLINRRAFEEQGNIFFAEYLRYDIPASVILFDLDHFKQINDTLGHLEGDRILKAVAAALLPTFRSSDIFARWGGEEFVVALQHMDADDALLVAERIRREVAAVTVAGASQRSSTPVTASLGVATFTRRDSGLESVLERADRALYQAKAGGRNQACTLEFHADAIA